MGFFDSVFSLLSSDVHADDNQARDEIQSGDGKAYGEAHETPDHKDDASAQKSTEESSKDVKGTPKETDESDKPFTGEKGSEDTDEQAEAKDDEEEEAPEEEEEEEEDEPVDPMPRLLQGEFAKLRCCGWGLVAMCFCERLAACCRCAPLSVVAAHVAPKFDKSHWLTISCFRMRKDQGVQARKGRVRRVHCACNSSRRQRAQGSPRGLC